MIDAPQGKIGKLLATEKPDTSSLEAQIKPEFLRT